MKILNSTKEFNNECNTAVTIGKFDGLHIGHQLLVGDIVSKKEDGLSSLVFTFTNSPNQYIYNTPDQMILSKEERREVVEGLLVDYFVEVPFDDAMMKLSPDEFLVLLINDLNMKHLCVGDDFKFGYKGAGNVEYLKEKSKEFGFSLRVVEKIEHDGKIVSSTYVRNLIMNGETGLAGELLNRDYRISGEIIHGKAIGRTLGIPTINIEPTADKLLPSFGVYYSTVIMDGINYPSITNIGMKPTVANTVKPIVESHLFDVTGDFYGKAATVIFHEKLRDEMKFSGLEELQNQMLSDVQTGKFWFMER